MSMGRGGYAERIWMDNQVVIYTYGGYNWNDSDYENKKHFQDGIIIIPKECFLRLRIQMLFNMRKKKKLRPNCEQLLADKKILVKNSKNCWVHLAWSEEVDTDVQVDFTAFHLVIKIFEYFCEKKKIKKNVTWFQ